MNGSSDPFLGEGDPMADLRAEFPDLFPPQEQAPAPAPEDSELARVLSEIHETLEYQLPVYNAPQMTTPFDQAPFQPTTQPGILDGFPRIDELVLQGPIQPTQTMSSDGFLDIDSLVYQGPSQSNQIQPQNLSLSLPVAGTSAGTSSLSDAPPARSLTSSLSDAPPALSTRSVKTSATPARRTASSRKVSKAEDDDEPIEVVPRKFFPPAGARKQHRSGFRQVPEPDGTTKKGRPSKKAYKEAGVEIDMYAHKKVLLPANGDEVDTDAPKPKKKPRKTRNAKAASATKKVTSEPPAESQSAPSLPSVPEVNPLSFSQPLTRESQIGAGVDLSLPGVDWNSYMASLGPPPDTMVQTQPNVNSFSMNPRNGNSFPMLQTQSDGSYPMTQTQGNMNSFPMAQTQSHAGYGPDLTYLPVPSNTPFPSASSTRLPTLGNALEPNFQSFSFQDGGANSANQLSSVTNNSNFGSTASFSQAPGMSGLGPMEYGSFPLSAQASTMGTSNSHAGSSVQLNELYNSSRLSLPPQASYMDTSVSNIGSSHQSTTGLNTNLFQPNNQYVAPATNSEVSLQASLNLNAYLDQNMNYEAPAANVGVSTASVSDFNTFGNQQGQYQAPAANVGVSTVSTVSDFNTFGNQQGQYQAPAANVGVSTQANNLALNTFLNQQGQYQAPSANVGANTQATDLDFNIFLNQQIQLQSPAANVGVGTQAANLDFNTLLNQQGQYQAPAANVGVNAQPTEFNFEAWLAQQGQHAPPNSFL